MGGKSHAAQNQAKQAQIQEDQRQAAIRDGTTRINNIFDNGAGLGTNKITNPAAFNPGQTYYNADGTIWNPALQYHLVDGTTDPANYTPTASDFAIGVQQGIYGDTTHSGGFNNDYYNNIQNDYMNWANPQLQDQYGEAQRQLAYNLARGGNLDSSTRADQEGELQKQYDLNQQQIGTQAIAQKTQAQNAVEAARGNLIGQLNSTGDVQGAANSAMNQEQALSQPQNYSPLSQMFSNFTNGLATQAAVLKSANATGGGGFLAGGSTGPGAPNVSGAVKYS